MVVMNTLLRVDEHESGAQCGLNVVPVMAEPGSWPEYSRESITAFSTLKGESHGPKIRNPEAKKNERWAKRSFSHVTFMHMSATTMVRRAAKTFHMWLGMPNSKPHRHNVGWV